MSLCPSAPPPGELSSERETEGALSAASRHLSQRERQVKYANLELGDRP